MEYGKAMIAGTITRRKPKFLRRKTAGDAVFDTFNYIFLVIFGLTILYPFWMTIMVSFSETEEATRLGFHLWLKNWNINAYKFALSKYGNVPVAYLNSIYRTLVGTFLTITVTLLAAYPLSKRNLPGRNILTIFILITMFFSGGLIPSYLLIKGLGLIDSRWALILPTLAMGFNTIIMRNFLMTIDSGYEESAFIDGANYLQILIRIIVPLSKPVIAVIALWTAVMHWNAWFDALLYINSNSKVVLQLLLRKMIQVNYMVQRLLLEYASIEEMDLPSESVKAAVTIITIGPIIFLYPFLQKYFIKGVFIGSLKG